jgi:putative ABC transport system ATP-binding protein
MRGAVAPAGPPPGSGETSTVLELVDVSLAVPSRQLLDGVSIEVRAGACVAVVGPSGAGKTSLLNCMSGITRTDGGEVRVGDTVLSRLSAGKRSAFRLRNLGMVFQFGELLPELTAVENVALPSRLMGVPRAEAGKRAADWLSRFDLGEQMEAHPDSLSGGEQQRVGLARALAHRPRLVLADEPTGMLDAENTELVVELLIAAAHEVGTTVVLVTHDPDVASAADQVYRLADGTLRPEPAVVTKTAP